MTLRKNLANKITALRILAVPVIMFLVLSGMELAALIFFLMASVSDMVDGYIARNQGEESPFGKFADPIADKLLVSAVFVSFVQLNLLNAVPVVVIVGREFLVTGLRLLAVMRNDVISASWWGKIKMISHITLIVTILIAKGWGWELAIWLKPWLVYTAVGLTLVSGADYLRKNRKLFRGVF